VNTLNIKDIYFALWTAFEFPTYVVRIVHKTWLRLHGVRGIQKLPNVFRRYFKKLFLLHVWILLAADFRVDELIDEGALDATIFFASEEVVSEESNLGHRLTLLFL